MLRVIRGLEWILDKILLVLFTTMVFSIVYQVFARYVLEQPTAWSEELARFIMVAVTMLGSALVLGNKGHVAVTIFVEILPMPVQRVIAILRDLLIVGMGGVLAYYGYGFALAGGRRTSNGLNIPMLYPYTALCIGGVLIALFVIFRRLRNPDDL